ncbi:MAG: MBL fold metallo-hydrolase [Spirochaetaceae bacterium]|nr:MBL fold metallo-hydrolase [Spirochaetaceae bacterium]HPG28502.1 MBL fold metallo-hydrolase [Myxococcota bacterium]
MGEQKSWRIGDVKITRVLEQVAPLPPEGLIANIDPARLAEHRSWLQPHFMNEAGQILLSIHALVVESGGRRIVVDTCMGNDRPLPRDMGPLSTAFLEELTQVVAREDVDTVLCTHLHFDHVGWNTMLVDGAFVPTFPNARYLFAREEYEHWTKSPEDENIVFQYGVDPIVAAGLHTLVESDHRLTDEVRLEPTPGHTPGHVSVVIESRGERAVITGDMVHHPVQLAEPHWGSHPDTLPERAIETRRDFVARYGDQPVLVIGTHFAGPTAGHIVREGGSCRFRGAS